MSKREIKRETLIRNLKRAIERAEHLDLPATIKEIYAFGGILRGKEKLPDLDLIFVYEQTPEQKKRWERFRKNFSTIFNDDEREVSYKELRDILWPYYSKGIPLPEAVMKEEVSNRLLQWGIEPKWTGCFSWTDFFFSPLGIFAPDLNKVMKKLLCRGMKGLQIFFEEYNHFKKYGPSLTAKNYRLIWTPENPDIEKNLMLEGVEKLAFIVTELEHFLNTLQEYREKFEEAKQMVAESAEEAGLKVSFEKLDANHASINYEDNDSCQVLLKKCELARKEMREYLKETIVLQSLAHNIRRAKELKEDGPNWYKHSVEDYAVYWTIQNIRKSDVKEEKIREVLSNLGLPENHVVTITSCGPSGCGTSYELEPNEKKRKKLLEKAEKERIRSKYIKPLLRLARSIDKNYGIFIELEKGKPTSLDIIYSSWIRSEKDRERVITELKMRGFELSQIEGSYIYACKSIKLAGNEKLSDLKKLLKDSITKIG